MVIMVVVMSRGPHLAVWPLTCCLCCQVVALVMDGESDPSPAVAEEAGERVEPMEATPSPQPHTTPASVEAGGEAVSMETEDGATEDNEDDDVVLVGEEASQPTAAATTPQDTPSADSQEPPAAASAAVDMSVSAPPSVTADSPESSNSTAAAPAMAAAEPIVIDDEEDLESKDASLSSPQPPGGSSPSHSSGALSSTEPDSEIRIANVTTLGSGDQKEEPSALAADDVHQEDMNLMITSVTSLQGGAAAVTEVRNTRATVSFRGFPLNLVGFEKNAQFCFICSSLNENTKKTVSLIFKPLLVGLL